MYPRNAATPPKLAIGPVVQISDGAVQTGGVSVVVCPEGGTESAGGGTVTYGDSSGIVYYAPTQAETNYTAFAVAAYKAGCIPASVTVVTTACATAGHVVPADDSITAEKFDESTAFPLKLADTGATAVARIGADGDTLETISDQLDAVKTDTAAILADTGTDGVVVASGSKSGYSLVADQSDVTIGTVTTLTGHTAQTGDAYARLGAPAGASVSADVAAIKSQTAAIEADTQDLQTQIGTDGAGLTAIGDTRLANLDAAITTRSSHSAADVKTAVEAAGTKLTAIHAKLPSKDYLTGTANSDGDLQANEATGNFPGTVGKSAATLAAGDVTGNIPADVKAYTVQPTVTGATLSSAYDAAKTAAQTSNLPANFSTVTVSDGKIAADALVSLTEGDISDIADATAAAVVSAGIPTAQSIRQEIDANSTQLAAIVADTNELQVELANGGRTDLLIDGIKAKTDTLPASPAAVGSQMDLVNAPNATAITAIQSGLATPTNITAGTITTVTNLTNAPTNGDLTAAMKASVTAAVPSASAIGTDAAGKVLATPAQKLVTDASGRVTVGSNADKTGYSLTVTPPTAADIKTALEAAGSNLAQILEDTGTTLPAAISGIEAGTGGDATAANQATIIAHLTDVKGTAFVKDANSLVNVTGAAPVELTVESEVST